MLIAIIILSWLFFNTWFFLIECYILDNNFIATDQEFADLIIFTFVGMPGILIVKLIHKIKNKKKKR